MSKTSRLFSNNNKNFDKKISIIENGKSHTRFKIDKVRASTRIRIVN